MNKKLLRSKMALFGDNYKSLADYIGVTEQTFGNKVNEYRGSEFTQGEILAIRERYKLSDEEVINIFFDEEVSK